MPTQHRVIIRHTGPPGPRGASFPTGGTENQVLAKNSFTDGDFKWITIPEASDLNYVAGPSTTVVGRVAVFSTTGGNELVQSDILFSDLATKAYADAVSQEDFTTELKNDLLDILNAFPTHFDRFRGKYGTPGALVSDIADPEFGDWAIATVGGQNRPFLYDEAAGGSWVDWGSYAAAMTAQQIADLVFSDATSFDAADSNIFTDAYKAKVDSLDTLLGVVSGGIATGTSQIRTVSDNHTLLTTDRTVVFNIGAGLTKTCQLPDPTANSGRVYAIKCLVGTKVTILRNGSEKIDGVAADRDVLTDECCTIQSTGTDWIVLSQV